MYNTLLFSVCGIWSHTLNWKYVFSVFLFHSAMEIKKQTVKILKKINLFLFLLFEGNLIYPLNVATLFDLYFYDCLF